jgi:hypothetical protein
VHSTSMSRNTPVQAFLRSLDQALESELAPLGFTRHSGKHLMLAGGKSHPTVHIEIQRGRGLLLNCFAVNLQFIGAAGTAASKKRVGAWPYSFTDLPQTLILSPLSHTLIPVLWVALFTDRWWRVPKSEWLRSITLRSTVHAVKREVHSLAARSEA